VGRRDHARSWASMPSRSPSLPTSGCSRRCCRARGSSPATLPGRCRPDWDKRPIVPADPATRARHASPLQAGVRGA
jgi:hypothetical protein